ncbi:hypothetical protein [Zooshikella sp. RANM57]|uniref:hypothetical protein n=1 Tax=Zooshikella sp. RANM57 TaxID=3425863 RepID=UPI003D6E3EB7
MFWKRKKSFKLIPVRPKNYQCICLHAIEIATDPNVLMDKKLITDLSDSGKLSQERIRNCINFEIRDGDVGVVGFHDHPDEMWINEKYQGFAIYCEQMGWLKIEGQPLNKLGLWLLTLLKAMIMRENIGILDDFHLSSRKYKEFCGVWRE